MVSHRQSRKLTVSQAAIHLSTTESAIRHRVNRNSIPHEKDEETNRVYILIEELEGEGITEDDQRARDSEPADNGRSTERLIETLTRQLEATQESLRYEREANRENRRLLAAALERIPALEAPQEASSEPRGAPETASPRSDGASAAAPEGEHEPPHRRSWFYRFFFGE